MYIILRPIVKNHLYELIAWGQSFETTLDYPSSYICCTREHLSKFFTEQEPKNTYSVK